MYRRRITLSSGFNPRSRTGSDSQPPLHTGIISGFNPRSRTGSDWLLGGGLSFDCCFNPRSRTGSDSDVDHIVCHQANRFNPRSRTGSDQGLPDKERQLSMFQSTLPHGERQRMRMLTTLTRWFQSTLPHGERPITSVLLGSKIKSFNPRSRTGSDLMQKGRLSLAEAFQSTLPHGERRQIWGQAPSPP